MARIGPGVPGCFKVIHSEFQLAGRPSASVVLWSPDWRTLIASPDFTFRYQGDRSSRFDLFAGPGDLSEGSRAFTILTVSHISRSVSRSRKIHAHQTLLL